MNFICDDNSYRSTQAAIDLTAAVQVDLMSSSDFEWVERPELQKADQELKLLSFGLIDRSEAIRLGRWLKADWAVFGRISTNSATGRAMRLEVVDLDHADVLAQASLPLSPQPQVALKLTAAEISDTAAGVRRLINQASQTAASNLGKSLVAFLFLAPEIMVDEPANFSDKFQDRLNAELTNSVLHLLHFQRAAVSKDEAELVLSGFAQEGRDPKERLADLYLWGSFVSRSRQNFDPVQRRFNKEKIFQITLTLWDGNTQPRPVTLSITNADSEDSIAQQLAHLAVPFLLSASPASNSEGARQLAADSILKQAMALLGRRGHPSLDTPTGRKDWLDLVQMFEAASFFDPLNVSAREWAARLRWSNFVGYNSRNEFFFARRRSEAWGKYVDDFGFRSGPLPPPSSWGTPDTVAKEYVLSAWRPFEMFRFSQYNQAEWGIPRDAGALELAAWNAQFSEEFFKRLLRAPDDPALRPQSYDFLLSGLSASGDRFLIQNPQQRQRVLDVLWPRILELQRANPLNPYSDILPVLALHYQRVGKPGAEKALIAQLKQIAEDAHPQKPAPHQVKLPRIAVLNSAGADDLFALPFPVFAPAESGPPDQAFHLAPRLGIQSIKAAAFHQGKIWLSLEIAESVADTTADATGDSNLNELKRGAMRLWVLDPQTRSLARATGPLATNNISSLLSSGPTLWAGLVEGGVVAWNTEQNTVQLYGEAQGLAATNQYGLVGGAAGLFTMGGLTNLSWLAVGQNHWAPVPIDLNGAFKLPHIGDSRKLAASGDFLLLFNLALLVNDLHSNHWTRVDQTLSSFAGSIGLGRVTHLVGDGNGGFWVASESGLHFVDAPRGLVRSQLIEKSFSIASLPSFPVPAGMRFPAAFQPHHPDTELDRQLGEVLNLRHRWASSVRTNVGAVNPFKPTSRLPGAPSALALDGGLLWVLTSDPQTTYTSRLLLYDPANHAWINSAQVRGDQLTLLAHAGKAWVFSASPHSMDVYSFDREQWLKTSPQPRASDSVSSNELDAFLSKLPASQQALCRLFWGEPDRVTAILSDQDQVESDPKSLFLLALANDADGLNHAAEESKYAQSLISEFPENRFARYLLAQQKLAQVRSRVAERKNSTAITNGPAASASTNRTQLASERATSFLRDYDADGDGKISVDELAVACELEPDRLPFTPYQFDPNKPLESARQLMNGLSVYPNSILDLAALNRGFLSHPTRSEVRTPGSRNPGFRFPPGFKKQP